MNVLYIKLINKIIYYKNVKAYTIKIIPDKLIQIKLIY